MPSPVAEASRPVIHVSQNSVRRMVRQLHSHMPEQLQNLMECRNRAWELTAAGFAFSAKSEAHKPEDGRNAMDGADSSTMGSSANSMNSSLSSSPSSFSDICFVEVPSEKDVRNNFIPNGPLSGVAVAVSDALDVQEFHTRSGLDTPMFHHAARKEFPLISWLRRQGAQVVGKLSCRTPLAVNEGCIFGKKKPASIAVVNRCCHYCISCSLNGPASIACAVSHDICGFKPSAQTFGTFTEQFKLSMPSMTLGIAAKRVDDLLYLWQLYTSAITPSEEEGKPGNKLDGKASGGHVATAWREAGGTFARQRPADPKYASPEMIDHHPSNYTIKDRRGRMSDIDVGWRDYNAEAAAANDFNAAAAAASMGPPTSSAPWWNPFSWKNNANNRGGHGGMGAPRKAARYEAPRVELTVGYPAEWIDQYCQKMYGTSKEFAHKLTNTALERSAFSKNQKMEVVPLSFDVAIEDVIHAVSVISHYELANAFENLFVGGSGTSTGEEKSTTKPSSTPGNSTARPATSDGVNGKEAAKRGTGKDAGVQDKNYPELVTVDPNTPAALNRPHTFEAMSGVLEELPKEIVSSIYKGQGLTLSDYHSALRLRDDVVRATEEQFHDVDTIVVPLLAEPYTVGNMKSVALTLPFHLGGNPLLSIQIEKDMPVALVGELGRDAALLEDSFCFLQFVRGASPKWWRQKVLKIN